MLDRYILVAGAHFTGAALAVKTLGYVLPESVTSYYTWIAHIALFAVLSWHAFKITKQYFLKDRISTQNKAVLITGCDSGFGHHLAKRLDSKGFQVLATCLFPSGEGADSLRNSCTSRLHIIELDVTKDESVQKAVTVVEQHLGSLELWAIVNNAGIVKGLSADVSSVQDFKDCAEVNLYGMIRVTKAFLPFLKKSKGRVVNVTSIAGRVCIPHANPYITTKHAAVGFSDSLRQELVDWDVKVISIEPELFLTNLTCPANADRNMKQAFSHTLREYDDDYQAHFKKSQDTFISIASSNIQLVVDDMEAAISLEHPDDVYGPCRNDFVRFLMFFYVNSPIALRDFFVKIGMMVLRYKKPTAATK